MKHGLDLRRFIRKYGHQMGLEPLLFFHLHQLPIEWRAIFAEPTTFLKHQDSGVPEANVACSTECELKIFVFANEKIMSSATIKIAMFDVISSHFFIGPFLDSE